LNSNVDSNHETSLLHATAYQNSMLHATSFHRLLELYNHLPMPNEPS